jgi:uncharacterized protein YacL
MIFKNISNFSNVNDYLPILNAIIITDLFVLTRVVFRQIKIKSLNEWYNKYNLSAVLTDVLSIMIGIILTRYIYNFIFKNFNIIYFCILSVCIQVTHDILFAFMFNSIPIGRSAMLDTFKKYAKEVGFTILVADALMMISSIIIGSILANLSLNTNLIILIILLYITPYFIYSIN